MGNKNWSVYERRRDTVKKKASELSSLCNVQVCMLCFGPAGDFTSWPEDPSEVASIIHNYNKAVIANRNASNNKKRKWSEKLDLSDVLGSKIKALQKQLLSGSEQRLDLLSKESLEELAGCLESKLRVIELRIGILLAEEWCPLPIEQHPAPAPAPSTLPSQHEDPEFLAVLQSLLS